MKEYLVLLARLSRLFSGIEKYGNPGHVLLKRAFSKNGLMTITDRRTGISVRAAVQSSHMFGTTWHAHDYDVPGCPLRPGDTVVDIGANQGFFTCYAAVKGARVYAFEPSPESFDRLEQNIARNGFSSVVKASRTAVSSSTGKTRFWRFDYLGGGADTMVASHMEYIPDKAKPIEVDTIDINSVLAAIAGRVRLCKMDCEGAEFEILKHLSDPSQIDSFAIEYHPRTYPFRELLDAVLGWQTHQITVLSERNILYAVRNAALLELAESH